MKIIVTGGGLIGPTLARRLRPAGHDGRRRSRDSRPIAFLFCSQARDPRR
jgi:nucleoside-diphosphate-sugar epimerase